MPGRPADRRGSVDVAERMFDLLMMVLVAVLGVIFTVLGVMMSSTWSIIGGLVVIGSIVPLWLGGRSSTGDRSGRPLRWYPVALLVGVIGTVIWLQPWGY